MTRMARLVALGFAIAMAGGFAAPGPVIAKEPVAKDAIAKDPASSSTIVPHRAVYDLRLMNTRGKRSLQAIRGRILYDFSGSACEGYALQFRQVSELDTGEGRVIMSDLRATSWEEGQGQRLTFHSENYLDDNLRESVTGEARRSDKGVAVRISKPEERSLDLDRGLIFPTQHVRRVLTAAKEGQTILQIGVYDGSETGDKSYDTMTVIGRRMEPGEKPDDVAGREPTLAGLARWPVTVSYFDRGKPAGEQTPVYAISFELYENGISRALVLDYNDFVVAGDMTSLDVNEAKPCP